VAETPAETAGTCVRCEADVLIGARYCGVCGAHLHVGTGPDELVGTVVAERYRIISRIGQSASGTVLQAEHVSMGKLVAVKLIHEELSENPAVVRRFERDFRAISRLTEMRTVGVVEFGRHEGRLYVVTEYLRGRNLASVVHEEGPLALPRIATLVADVSQSLTEAHQHGIVHGGLKSENLFLTQVVEGREMGKILDYGLAGLLEVQDEAALGSGRGPVGVPQCMSPEQVSGTPVDPRSDIYSFGALIYLMLTGGHAFTARTPVGVLKKHLVEDPMPPSEREPSLGIPPAVDAIVLRAMAKRPRDRYLEAVALSDDLHAAIAAA
jgi:serine/threonine protein kinase